jgi:chromosome partitioning protein
MAPYLTTLPVVTKIVSVHSRKGGVGKTTIAYELAWLLGGVLVDLEWDDGGATRAWGYNHEDRVGAPMVEALERGRTQRPIVGHRKPALVPGHPTLGQLDIAAEDVFKVLRSWANDWDTEWVVVDTHPGSNPWSDGANAVANLVLAPVPLKTKELEAIAGMVKEMADYPLQRPHRGSYGLCGWPSSRDAAPPPVSLAGFLTTTQVRPRTVL